MPPKGAFTLARLQEFGAVAAEGVRGRLASDGEPPCGQLTCEYCGVATHDEEYVAHDIPTGRSTLAYEWQARVGGRYEQTVVKVRCDKISNQGIPFPKTWHTALRCANLQAVGDEAAKAAREEIGGEIDCKLLGVAVRTTLPQPGEHKPGSTVLLPGGGSPMAFILFAKIDDDSWLCHRGSFQDGKLNETDPLNYDDVVAMSNLSR